MRINVTFGERFVSRDLPQGVWAGLTVYDNGCHWTEMNLLEKSDEQTDIEIVNEDGKVAVEKITSEIKLNLGKAKDLGVLTNL